MALSAASNLGLKFLQVAPIGLLAPCINSTCVNLQLVRYRRTKHWLPKWKKLRGMKVVKVDLPNYNENPDEMSKEEIRTKMKEKGILPPRPWMERPFYISCTGGVFEPYVPPEGDGKVSVITKTGAKQKLEYLEKKSKSMLAVRKIRGFEEDFEPKPFVDAAQEIYINAHNFFLSKDKIKVREFVTERAYPEMRHNVHDKTIRWKFIQSIEPPRMVHARCTDVITRENIFAQVTVRFHTQQMLAIYDRFGRLIHGSEILAKDVLEYIVFEKHLANQYGTWRMHEKIIPEWMPPREHIQKTFRVPEPPPPEVPEPSSPPALVPTEGATASVATA